jgi:hypothetical protein
MLLLRHHRRHNRQYRQSCHVETSLRGETATIRQKHKRVDLVAGGTPFAVGWSVNGSLTTRLVQPLPSASLLRVRAAAISPTIATAANSVFNIAP